QLVRKPSPASHYEGSGIIATFEPAPCGGGSLSLTTPASASFPGLTLNGTNQTVTTTLVLPPTTSGAGWNITGTSTTLTTTSNQTLPTTSSSAVPETARGHPPTCVPFPRRLDPAHDPDVLAKTALG